jgi:tRNA-specific 2-thiouridylase
VLRQRFSNKKTRPASKRVFVGLSGGVDSAVCAALLQKEGCDVTGVFIKIQIPGYPCPAAQDRIEAMRVAAHLDIPFIEIDLSKEYEKEVFRPSVSEFERGHTPNPDTLCNEKIKFGVFFDFCRSRGADFVATGHYARAENGMLLKGADPAKDQSYFLWAVPEAIMRFVLFPLGGKRKDEVRALARRFGLPNAERRDSQGLCFLGPIGIDDMLQREVGSREGDVLSEAGEKIGVHRGAALYTLGERHGFSLLQHTPAAKAHYVIKKDIEGNTITVSAHQFPQNAKRTRVALSRVNWIGKVEDGPCLAQYRYHQRFIPAEIKREGGKAVVELLEPHYAPLGQSLVLFRGERCLGGGVIEDATLLS